MKDDGRTVISLGGSLFVPEMIDINFIRSFKKIMEDRIARGERFVIIIGGGKIARNYMNAGRELNFAPENLDWLGIYVTRLNAQFMRIEFGNLAHDEVVTDPNEVVNSPKPIIFGAGWKPGCSTDYDAVLMARAVGATKILNLSNTNYVYDKDPKQHPDAKERRTLTWDEYRALIPAEWHAGLSTPFDPIASKEAQSLGIRVLIINGTQLYDVAKALNDEAFDGTIIHN